MNILLLQFSDQVCQILDGRQCSKFIYSEKATKFCEIFTLLLSYVVPIKSKVKISQNFVAFSEYMNFTSKTLEVFKLNWLIDGSTQPKKLIIVLPVTKAEQNLAAGFDPQFSYSISRRGFLHQSFEEKLYFLPLIFRVSGSLKPPHLPFLTRALITYLCF